MAFSFVSGILAVLGAVAGAVVAVLAKEETAWSKSRVFFRYSVILSIICLASIAFVFFPRQISLVYFLMVLGIFLFSVFFAYFRNARVFALSSGLAAGFSSNPAAHGAAFMVLMLLSGLSLAVKSESLISFSLAFRKAGSIAVLYFIGFIAIYGL